MTAAGWVIASADIIAIALYGILVIRETKRFRIRREKILVRHARANKRKR